MKAKMAQLTFSLEDYHEHLEKDLVRLYRYDIPNQRFLIFGTSNEIVYPLLKSVFTGPEKITLHSSENSKYVVLSMLLEFFLEK